MPKKTNKDVFKIIKDRFPNFCLEEALKNSNKKSRKPTSKKTIDGIKKSKVKKTRGK